MRGPWKGEWRGSKEAAGARENTLEGVRAGHGRVDGEGVKEQLEREKMLQKERARAVEGCMERE